MALAFLAAACGKEDYARSEKIRVYTDAFPKADLSTIELDLAGGTMNIYVKANVDYQVSFQEPAETFTDNWIRIGEKKKVDGRDVIPVTFEPRGDVMTRRYGILTISSPKHYFSKYVTLKQGFDYAFKVQNFSSFKYGSTAPSVAGGETPYENWTTAQKDLGYTSTRIDGQDGCHLYGRNGFLQLGSDSGVGADLISPQIYKAELDRQMLVAFNALAFTEENGVQDNTNLTVQILGGGAFVGTDGATEKTFDVKALDRDAAKPWEGSLIYFSVANQGSNKITYNTRVRIIAGEMGQMDHPNRVFIDNFAVYSVTPEYLQSVEDFYGND